MTVAGCLIIILYVMGIIKHALNRDFEKMKYIVFITMIGFSIFVNIGYSVFHLPYNILLEVLYLGVCAICWIKRPNFKIGKKYVIAAMVLIGVICMGDINLMISDMPYIIPFSVSMDSVYHAENSLSKAFFSESNIQYLRYMVLFIVVMGFSLEYFHDDSMRKRIMTDVKKIFIGMFAIWTIEWIFNNFVSPELWREMVYSFFGNSNERKTYAVGFRFIGYSFNGLFTEPSYITVMVVFYSILWKEGLKTIKDYVIYLWSVLLLILNGTTSGMMLLIFALLLLVKNIAGTMKKETFEFVLVVILAAIVSIAFNYNSIQPIFDKILTYVQAYVGGGIYSSARETSAAIRNYGNSVAYAAFRASPFLGVGFGTTRGYGILPGTLACLGILGTVAYTYFIKEVFDIKLDLDSGVLLCLFIAYSATILSVWYLYFPALIPFCVCLGYSTKRTGGNVNIVTR